MKIDFVWDAKSDSMKIVYVMLYLKTQSVPRCKHFPPRLFKDQT